MLVFSGIVSDVGRIRARRAQAASVRFEIATRYAAAKIKLGSSICVNGACLTVVDKGTEKKSKTKKQNWFAVELSPESLAVTTAGAWRVGTRVHLEQALRIGERLDGHFVLGHVDGIARVRSRKDDGDCVLFVLDAPAKLMRFIAAKGSVTLDGVALTTNRIVGRSARGGGKGFEIMIIPHTLQETLWHGYKKAQSVNLEVDVLARYSVVTKSKGKNDE